MPDLFKSLFDGLDKITDILNIGRLIFYTSAGFCGLLPVAMSVRLLAADRLSPYWKQFFSDFVSCSRHFEIWLAAVVAGFIIATIANATVMVFPSPADPPSDNTKTYAFQYPRLFSGGIRSTAGPTKDYAAWLISEYYRYVEIAVFIPYAVRLSLPVYAVYTAAYLIRALGQAEGFSFAGHFAFILWAFSAALVWTVIWPDFWIPRVALPTYDSWVLARRRAIAGLIDFTKTPENPSGQK